MEDRIYEAVLEAPGIREKISDDDARRIAYEVREAVDLGQSRFGELEEALRLAERHEAILNLSVPWVGDWDRVTVIVGDIGEGDQAIGWAHAQGRVFCINKAAEHYPALVLNLLSGWWARQSDDGGGPLMSVLTSPEDPSLVLPGEEWRYERLPDPKVSGGELLFPYRAAIGPGWIYVGARPGWLVDAVNPDLVGPDAGKSKGRDRKVTE